MNSEIMDALFVLGTIFFLMTLIVIVPTMIFDRLFYQRFEDTAENQNSLRRSCPNETIKGL